MEHKILLADDHKLIAFAYKSGLESAGFRVLTASNGAEALEIIRQEKPDLILLDLLMPIKNGYDVLKEIKKDKELKKIPVIILSNLGHDSDIKKSKKLGAVDYLIKSNNGMSEIIKKAKSTLRDFRA